MPLILFATSSNVEDDHQLEFAVIDLNEALLAMLVRRCEFMNSALRQDELVSEIRYWDHQTCEYYSFDAIEDFLEKLPELGLNLPVDLLDPEKCFQIPFRPASQPERPDCREMCIAPDVGKGDHFIRWHTYPRHSDTIVLTPELRLSELRELAQPQPRKDHNK